MRYAVVLAEGDCVNACETPPPQFPDMKSLFRRTIENMALVDQDVFEMLNSAAVSLSSNSSFTCCANQVSQRPLLWFNDCI